MIKSELCFEEQHKNNPDKVCILWVELSSIDAGMIQPAVVEVSLGNMLNLKLLLKAQPSVSERV